MFRDLTLELLKFIEKSPSCYHAVANMKKELLAAGYQELSEHQPWSLNLGEGYFVTRNCSSLIAFRIPEDGFSGFQIMASHSDSPTFKVKEQAEISVDGHFTKLNVEKYGGMICAPWFDRPLSVAGRLMVEENGYLVTKLVNVARDLVMIPSLAIHMNRDVNDGHAYNAQVDMLPLFGDGEGGSLMKIVAEAACVPENSILGTDLFLYNRVKGTLWGSHEEFMSSPRLDDLQCAFASLKGFLAASPAGSIAVHCVLDNEEVGSGTKQGAASTFLKDTLMRINSSLGFSEDNYLMALASSFMVSADNAHSVHPNYRDKADPTNRPYLNHGIVIKYNANQKYTTDAVSAAIFKSICERAKVPCQIFTNRSDMAGGSTLGNISNTQVALNTVDIGLPQLAMHSPYETGGVRDTFYLVTAATTFFSSSLQAEKDGVYRLI